MIGAGVLYECQAATYYIHRQQFDSWSQNTKLPQFLISSDLHPQLLSSLETVISRLMNSDLILQLWSKIERSHRSQRSSLMAIVTGCLNQLSDEKIVELIQEILKTDFTSSDLIDFVVRASLKIFQNSSSTAIDLILSILIRLSSNNLSSMESIISTISTDFHSSDFFSQLIKQICLQLKNGLSIGTVLIIFDVIVANIYLPMSHFLRDICDCLLEYLKVPCDFRSEVFNLYAKVLNKQKN